MKKYLKFPLLKAGFAGIELILLVTMAVGIFAAVKLSQQPQNPQTQSATTGKWVDNTGAECKDGTTRYTQWFSMEGCELNQSHPNYKTIYALSAYGCSNDGSGKCYIPNGNKISIDGYSVHYDNDLTCFSGRTAPDYTIRKITDFSNKEDCTWKENPPPTTNTTCSSIGYCSYENDLCNPGYIGVGKKDCDQFFYCCANLTPTPDPSQGKWIDDLGSACTSTNSSPYYTQFYPLMNHCYGDYVVKIGSIPCATENKGKCFKARGPKNTITKKSFKSTSLGNECKPIPSQDQIPITDFTILDECEWSGTGGTGGGGPGGGPPPPGDGQPCGVFSNTKCTGLKVGEICDGSTTCTADGSKGTDGNLICKCDTGGGGGNGPPPSGYACSSLILDKNVIKPNETFNLTATANEESTDFFFVLYNTLTGQPACVEQGGDVTTDIAGCPEGTHKLIFKDTTNTASRTTGMRNLTLNDINLKDMYIWQPYGGYLRYLTFKAFMAKSGGAWTAENTACNQNAEIYRPAVCLNSSIDKMTLNPGESLNITLNGQAPAGTSISKYTTGFYNMDNLYGPGNAKPIFFEGSHYITSSESATIQVTYDELNRADENNNNQLPVNISVNGYFYLNDGGFSQVDPNCVEKFNIVRTDVSITPTPSDLTPTPSDLTPTPSGPTPSPTPSEDWYAPDGQLCDGINYLSLHSDSLCQVPAGYITDSEEINGGEENKCVSGKPCYKAGGVIIDPGEEAKFQSRSDIPDNCDAIEPGNLPPGTVYDQLLNCSYREAPKGNIQVKVKVSWDTDDEEEDKAKVSEERPFKFLRIYVQDTSPEPDNFLTFFDKTEGFQNGGTFEHTFTPLFNDITYKVYVTAYDDENQPIDNQGIYNQGSCESVACEKRPDDELLTFELRFPDSLKAASAQELNFLFETMVNKWINNQVSPLDISRFIRRLTQVPGLQKNTCDPKVPGGCTFNEKSN